MKKFQRFVILSFSVFGLLLALIPLFLFPVCRYNNSYMDCWGAGLFVMTMGMVIEFCSWYVRLGMPLSFCNVLSSAAALMAVLVPYRIIEPDKIFRLCDDATHACRTSTMPAVIVIASVIIILNIACVILHLKSRKLRSHSHS